MSSALIAVAVVDVYREIDATEKFVVISEKSERDAVSKVLFDFIMFVLESRSNQASFQICLADNQSDLANKLQSQVEIKGPAAIETLFSLFWTFIVTEQKDADGRDLDDVVIQFVIFSSLKSNGDFKSATKIAATIRAMKYLFRLSVYRRSREDARVYGESVVE